MAVDQVIILPIISDLDGSGVFRYIFLSAVSVAFGYVVVWGQTRSLYRAHRLLKEKDAALSEVARHREELEYFNKNITDSLLYAKKIQEALIPSEEFFRRHFSDSFIFFQPRDIVSGDFYYVCEKNNRTYVVVADCTGHGVPGALMSMIGLRMIDAIIEKDNPSPVVVLDNLNAEIEAAFHREDGFSQSIKDGMDIAICMIDKHARQVEFAGSFLPLYFVRDGKLNEIRGDKIIIGRRIDGQSFTNHNTSLEEGDIFYMLSDGYSDQFGGLDNKKFMNRRLRYLLLTIHRYSHSDQRDILSENISAWMGTNRQIDDMLVIGFRP